MSISGGQVRLKRKSRQNSVIIHMQINQQDMNSKITRLKILQDFWAIRIIKKHIVKLICNKKYFFEYDLKWQMYKFSIQIFLQLYFTLIKLLVVPYHFLYFKRFIIRVVDLKSFMIFSYMVWGLEWFRSSNRYHWYIYRNSAAKWGGGGS